jgi:hypothetical protein
MWGCGDAPDPEILGLLWGNHMPCVTPWGRRVVSLKTEMIS